MPPSKPNAQDFCPCHPEPEDAADRQLKREAFYRKCENAKELLKSVAVKYGDETTIADLYDLGSRIPTKPPYPADSLSAVLDFDGMVKEVGYRFFGKMIRDGQLIDIVNPPDFDSFASQAEVLERSFSKFSFENYLGGGCLHCQLRIEHAESEADHGKEGQRILRFLLGLFDRTGTPIPRELREWSQRSRLSKPPLGPRGRKGRNWLRNRCIIHTVATLAYLTGRSPTRNRESRKKLSCCDAVKRAYAKYGTRGIRYTTVANVWDKTEIDGDVLGQALLKAWLQEDREKNQALTEEQLNKKRARAIRRWARLPYWRQQNWWDET